MPFFNRLTSLQQTYLEIAIFCEPGIAEMKTEKSYSTPSPSFCPWNSSLQMMVMMLPGLRGVVTCQSIFSVRFTIGLQMETHSCSSSCWLHLSDQSMSVSLFFLTSVAKITANFQRAKRKSNLWNVAFLLLCVCTHRTSPLSTERAARGCYVAEVHHSHLPVCQMSCLAELHTVMVLTKWQKGGTLQWMSIWLQSTGSPGALKLPHTETEKGENCSL